MEYTYSDLAKMIDHSLLNPTLNAADLEAGCRLALSYDVASVCIMAGWSAASPCRKTLLPRRR